ncbi:MAG: UDP-glucose 4-epimerase GalE [Desulfotomaculaceae bacterium]|nr:UDP-glucose 4-epimerase GalE [Desulfotomaculaceae bacterium]
MNVMVTGGAGYIGSHTVRELENNGHQVLVLDNLSRGHQAAVAETFLIEGDTSDRELLKQLFTDFEIDAVMHFAASSQVGESVRLPSDYYQNNLVNGLNLMNAMLESRVRHLVFSSTAAVYGEPREVPIPEAHPTNPTNPYGATKLALEGAMRWYGEAYGLRWTSLRYFNAAGADPAGDIGEDHTPETHLIPLVLKVALGELPHLEVYGNDYATPDGTCVRDYIHVNDLAQAHVLALDALADGAPPSAYNLGNGSGYSVLEVIRTAEEVVGKTLPVKFAARRPGDPAMLVAGSDKIKSELGWQPAYPGLKDIIETAWRWHLGHPRGFEK